MVDKARSMTSADTTLMSLMSSSGISSVTCVVIAISLLILAVVVIVNVMHEEDRHRDRTPGVFDTSGTRSNRL